MNQNIKMVFFSVIVVAGMLGMYFISLNMGMMMEIQGSNNNHHSSKLFECSNCLSYSNPAGIPYCLVMKAVNLGYVVDGKRVQFELLKVPVCEVCLEESDKLDIKRIEEYLQEVGWGQTRIQSAIGAVEAFKKAVLEFSRGEKIIV